MHFDLEGVIVYQHACALGCEGIASAHPTGRASGSKTSSKLPRMTRPRVMRPIRRSGQAEAPSAAAIVDRFQAPDSPGEARLHSCPFQSCANCVAW